MWNSTIDTELKRTNDLTVLTNSLQPIILSILQSYNFVPIIKYIETNTATGYIGDQTSFINTLSNYTKAQYDLLYPTKREVDSTYSSRSSNIFNLTNSVTATPYATIEQDNQHRKDNINRTNQLTLHLSSKQRAISDICNTVVNSFDLDLIDYTNAILESIIKLQCLQNLCLDLDGTIANETLHSKRTFSLDTHEYKDLQSGLYANQTLYWKGNLIYLSGLQLLSFNQTTIDGLVGNLIGKVLNGIYLKDLQTNTYSAKQLIDKANNYLITVWQPIKDLLTTHQQILSTKTPSDTYQKLVDGNIPYPPGTLTIDDYLYVAFRNELTDSQRVDLRTWYIFWNSDNYYLSAQSAVDNYLYPSGFVYTVTALLVIYLYLCKLTPANIPTYLNIMNDLVNYYGISLPQTKSYYSTVISRLTPSTSYDSLFKLFSILLAGINTQLGGEHIVIQSLTTIHSGSQSGELLSYD